MNFHPGLRVLPFSFLLFLCICAPVAADIRFTAGKSALAIPFEMEDNLIYVPVSINGSKPLSFIFDTGAFNIVDLKRAREIGLPLRVTGKTGGIGDEQQEVHLGAGKISFGLPGVTLSNQRLLAVSLEKVEECVNKYAVDAYGRDVSSSTPANATRRAVDGILGAEFFSNFVVEIDYAARLINVYEPKSYKHSGRGEKLTLEVEPQHVFVKGKVFAHDRQPVTARFLVDTGGAMVVGLTRRFTDEHRLLPPKEELAPIPICGLAGTMSVPSQLGGIEALQLGNVKIAGPLVEFRRASVDYDYDGVIGGALFRRYKVIFDYSRRVMILEPPGGVKS